MDKAIVLLTTHQRREDDEPVQLSLCRSVDCLEYASHDDDDWIGEARVTGQLEREQDSVLDMTGDRKGT